MNKQFEHQVVCRKLICSVALGVIFQLRHPPPRYVALWFSEQTLKWAYSKNGVNDWVLEFENTELTQTVLAESGLQGETVVDLHGFEVPMSTKDQPIQRILVIMSTMSEDGTEMTAHTATLVRDVRSIDKVGLFYHAELLIHPVTFIEDGQPGSACGSEGCLDSRVR